MKKKLILISGALVTMAFLQFGFAQSWTITGNNNTTALSKLGTTNFIPLGLYTDNVKRVHIDEIGRVGIGINAPVNILTVKSTAGTPSGSWLTGLTSPVFVGFAENASSEFVLATASNVSPRRSVIQGRRSRGTLAAPTVVANNDYLTSFLASGYDGSAFQNPATIDFFVDGVPSSGNVPARISFVTGTNQGNRLERLKVGSTGNFNFNDNQLFLRQSDGNVGIGTTSPTAKLHVVGSSLFSDALNVTSGGISSTHTGVALYGNSTSGSYGVWGNSTYLGVYGSGSTYGVFGSGAYGVYGSGSSYGLFGSGGTYGVYGDGSSYGIYGNSGSGSGVRGVSSTGFGVYGSSGYLGVYGVGDSYGVYGYSANNYGVYGTSGYLGVYGAGNSYGVYGSSTDGWGVAGYSTSNFGVYGQSSTGNGGRFYSASGYGLWAATGRSDDNWAGVFDGNVYCFNAYQTSDKNLKKNIKEFTGAMSIIDKLKPKNYEFRRDEKYANLNLPKGSHYGLLAQDLEEVLPELVKESVHDLNFAKSNMLMASGAAKETGGAVQKDSGPNQTKDDITIKAVNYTELIPIIIKGMQEQQAQIKELSAVNEDLKNQLNELKALILKGANGGSITSLSGYLKQNVPNPSPNNTVISYYVPDNTKRAQIRITDMKGSALKMYTATPGNGQVNIKSGELPAGVYTYTLYANDKKIDSKQMVIK